VTALWAKHDLSRPLKDNTAQPFKRLYVDAHKSIAAEGPGNQPTYICGLTDLQTLDQPVKEHNFAKQISAEKADIEKAVQGKIGQVSNHQPGTSCTQGKLVTTDKEAALRQLVAAKEMTEFHKQTM